MTTIKIVETGETKTLECVIGGTDWIADEMMDCGVVVCEDGTADFEMEEAQYRWWKQWAEREVYIQETAEELGEEAIENVARIASKHNDMEDAQLACIEYLKEVR